jgi:methylmalonyl-CoA mutase N-terminal domain/subunit
MKNSKFRKAFEKWEAGTLSRSRERAPERGGLATASGVPVPPLCTPLDLEGFDEGRELGFPGEYPFTRGLQPTMYRGRLWTMRQYSGFSTAEETNRRFRYLLDHGQTGLSVAFDLPTQMGHDADSPAALGEVGRAGVSIQSLEDMEALFEGIPMEKVSTSMTINATAHVLLALYAAAAKRQGAPLAALRGTVQNDILKEYIARGAYIYPPGESLRLTRDVFAWCAREMPQWNMISISGYHIREAGATAVQELAFTLADAKAYVEAALAAGLAVDGFAPRLSFFFNGHSDFFEETAKFRAARRMWARMMRERFGAKDPRSMTMRFHVQTGGSALTAQEPDNNVVRVALQCLAAVLGGAQSIHTNARDEALALPTEESALIALRTQQIIAHETGAASTVDPLGGAYYVETLTNELEKQAFALMERIEKMGGTLAAIENGFVKAQIEESAYAFQRAVEKKERLVVGVNVHQPEKEAAPPLLKIDPAIEERQRQRVRALRKKRDNAAVERALGELKDAAREPSENLMPHTLAAVEAHATLGEISNALREIFGEYREGG